MKFFGFNFFFVMSHHRAWYRSYRIDPDMELTNWDSFDNLKSLFHQLLIDMPYMHGMVRGCSLHGEGLLPLQLGFSDYIMNMMEL